MLKFFLICLLYITSSVVHSEPHDEELRDAFNAMRIGNFSEAYCMLKPLAEAGNDEAQYNIGWMYHNGYGLRVNDHLALEWWLSASEQGNTDASFSIAMLYNLGEGQISKNLSKAVDYYLLAAENHYDGAIIILRSMLTRDDKAIDGRRQELINQYGTLFGPVLQVKAKRLNIRRAGSLEAGIVTRLEQGDKVIELHKQGKWSQIGILNSEAEDKTIAWAYNLLLEPYQEPVELEAPSPEIPSEEFVPARGTETDIQIDSYTTQPEIGSVREPLPVHEPAFDEE